MPSVVSRIDGRTSASRCPAASRSMHQMPHPPRAVWSTRRLAGDRDASRSPRSTDIPGVRTDSEALSEHRSPCSTRCNTRHTPHWWSAGICRRGGRISTGVCRPFSLPSAGVMVVLSFHRRAALTDPTLKRMSHPERSSVRSKVHTQTGREPSRTRSRLTPAAVRGPWMQGDVQLWTAGRSGGRYRRRQCSHRAHS